MSAKTAAPADSDYERHVLPLIEEASAAWVATWRASLKKDGRALTGGFPGTKAEARSWVQSTVTRALAARGLRITTSETASRATSDLYAAARRAWLSTAIPAE